MKDYCEIYGTLEKLEELNTIKSNIIPGSLVFESLAPFWDYYYDTPGHGIVQYVYLGLDKDYVVFDIARTAAMVRESTGYNFDVAKASVTFSDRFFQVVRLRHFGSYDQLKTIQEGFVRLGINPVFVGGNWQKQTAKIVLRKVFCLNKWHEGVYADSSEQHHYYIEIPRSLSFEEFTEVTQKVKHNWLGHKFDAALGTYIRHQDVTEVVRIYTEVVSLDDLLEIQKLYHQKIK